LENRPVIADFLTMQPSDAFAGKMLKSKLYPTRSQRRLSHLSETEVYLGYTITISMSFAFALIPNRAKFALTWSGASRSMTTISSLRPGYLQRPQKTASFST